eukprot:2155592-Amphidinium_carterae.2
MARAGVHLLELQELGSKGNTPPGVGQFAIYPLLRCAWENTLQREGAVLCHRGQVLHAACHGAIVLQTLLLRLNLVVLRSSRRRLSRCCRQPGGLAFICNFAALLLSWLAPEPLLLWQLAL